jgi:hypothetical protein
MKNTKLLIVGLCISSSLFAQGAFAETETKSVVPSLGIVESTEIKTNAEVPKISSISEVMIKNQEPINVSVMNFPVSKDIQKVDIQNTSPLLVEIQNEVSLKTPEQNKIVSLNQSTNTVVVENFTVLGTISSSLQDITVSKTQVASHGAFKEGLKIKMVADDDLEVSKDIKVLIENISYIDIEEVKTLSDSIKVMIDYSKKDLKNKDFKVSWNSKNDLTVSLYTVNKMFGAVKGIEASMVIGKNSKYESKAILSVKELEEFKTFLDNYEQTKITQ